MSTSEDETQREGAKGSREADTNTSIQTIENVENEPSHSSSQIDEKETPESSVQAKSKCEVKQSKKAKNTEAEMEVEHQSLDRIPSVSERNIQSSNENDHDMNEGISLCQTSEENSQIKSVDIESMNPSSDDSEAVLKRKIVTKSPKAGETYQKRTRANDSEEDSDYATTVPDTLESRQSENIPSIVIEKVEVATSSMEFEFSCNVDIRLQPCSDSDASSEDCKQRLVESDSDNDDNTSISGVMKSELYIPEVDSRDISQVETVSNPSMSNSSTNASLVSFDETLDSGIQSSSMCTLNMYEPEMDDSIISSGDTVMTALSNAESIAESTTGVHSGESLHSSVSDIPVDAVNPTENAKMSEENTAEVEKQCPVSDSSSCRENVQEDLVENKSTDTYDIGTEHSKSSLTEKQQENHVEMASATSGGLETMSAVGLRDDSPCDDSNMSLSLYSEHSSEYDHSSSTTASNTDEIPSLGQPVKKKGKTALSPLYAYTKGKKNVGKGSPAQQIEGTPAVLAPDVEVAEVESLPNLVTGADSTVSTNREEKLPSSRNADDDDVIDEVQNESNSLYSGNERGQELSPQDRYYKYWKVFADKQWNKGEKFNDAFTKSIRNFEQQRAEPTSLHEPTGPIDCGQDSDIEEGVQRSRLRNDAEHPTDGEAVATGAPDAQDVVAAEDAQMVSNFSDSGSSEEGDFLSPPRDARLLPLFVKMDEMRRGIEEIDEDFDPYAQISDIVSVPNDLPFRTKDLTKMGFMLDTFFSAR